MKRNGIDRLQSHCVRIDAHQLSIRSRYLFEKVIIRRNVSVWAVFVEILNIIVSAFLLHRASHKFFNSLSLSHSLTFKFQQLSRQQK
jgi:hypothetical protein